MRVQVPMESEASADLPPGGRVLVGVDVGATTIAGCLATEGGRILATAGTPTRGRGQGQAVETLLDLVADLVAEARRREVAIAGIGIGLPGLVDAERGVMTSAVNLVGEFADVPLADRLGASTGVPVFVDNDVNALTLGEWAFGAGRGADSLAVVAIGTGIGGGLILDHRLVRGRAGCAGEIGHVPVDLDGPACLCGGRGCVTTYIGGRQLVQAAREEIARGAASTLTARAGGDPGRITTTMVFEAAAAGDPLAAPLVTRACRALGAGIATVVNVVDPGLIIVTGGVAPSLLPRQAEILASTARYALGHALRSTRIVIVPSDKRRTVLGGAALALYELGRRGARAGALDAPAVSRPEALA